MKTSHTFKGTWFIGAMLAAIIVGEFVAWKIHTLYALHANPIVVAFVCAGIVAGITSVLFEDADIG